MDNCEFPKFNASTPEIEKILRESKTIAVVGISPKEERPSHWIAKYLIDQGYEVFGVNPGMKEFEGKPVYPSLLDIPKPVDIVDIYRRPEEVPALVDQAIQIKAKVVWMQDGVVHNEAGEKARKAGLLVIMNDCIYRRHSSL